MVCVCVSEACLLKHASHVSCNAAVLGANEVSSQSTRLLMFSHLCAIMAMGIGKRDLYWMWLCFGLSRVCLCPPEDWAAYFYFHFASQVVASLYLRQALQYILVGKRKENGKHTPPIQMHLEMKYIAWQYMSSG